MMKNNTESPCYIQNLDFEVHAPDRIYSINVQEIAAQQEPSRICEGEFIDILSLWLRDWREYYDVEYVRLNGKSVLRIKESD